MNTRLATYRVQFRPEFGFEAARALVDYWAALGVSHVYSSPCLQAANGSSHGYDVVDHHNVNAELGGDAGRSAFIASLREHRLSLLLDVVPNHMAIRGGHNAWWWDVLENGPSSRYSSYFDVEWQSEVEDRVLLPILGDQYGVELEGGRIQLGRAEAQFVIAYYEHRNPVAPRSLGTVLSRAAERIHSAELSFLADAFSELPLPNARDRKSRKRRHRDKQVLHQNLDRLLATSDEVTKAVEQVMVEFNADKDQLHDLLERQNYRLAWWRVGNQELDYRRFFDIDSLVGLRAEDEEVFAATHELPLRWVAQGEIDGLRIDHIDGLYDPIGYLERLRQHAPNAWLLVEKILEGDEPLTPLPVEGTTGYDFLNHAQRLFIDPRGESALSQLHRELNPEDDDFEELVQRCKHLVLEEALASDLNRLGARLVRICYQHRRYRDFSREELVAALRELCVAFPVYRTYARPDSEGLQDEDKQVVTRATQIARGRCPELDGGVFEFLERLLTLQWRGEAELEFVMRLQQATGPGMAKGLEDTAFYRHARLVALNEVGGDPSHFSESAWDYHDWVLARQTRQREPLNATSTHDTKRSEDVRARLLVLSELPTLWADAVTRWRARLSTARSQCPSASLEQAPEPGFEYFLLQNLVGAWPIECERMVEFATKAMREAKRHTSWQRQNEAYEAAVITYLERLYADEELLAEVEAFVAQIADAGYSNSLNQLLLKVLSPGVPDIYQGTELWDFSLVDPDNRRPVDYELRRRLLSQVEELSAGELWEQRANGAVKLHFLKRALALRARYPDAFAPGAEYQPLGAAGRAQDRVVSFLRGPVLVVLTRWHAREGTNFSDTVLTLPPGTWRNVLWAGSALSGVVNINDILGPFPAAVLERQQGEG